MSSGFQLAVRQAEAYQSYTHAFMEGSARLLVGGAAVAPGDAVLDLACGTGLVARHAVNRVSPGGRVVGADVNKAMLGVARHGNADTVAWVAATSETLPFGAGRFSHVICQQGFQFFPDPAAAMTEVRRVLRPGGLLLATVWATPGQNPYIETQLDLLAAIDPALVPSVRRATPPNADELLRSLAVSAGFADATVSLLEHTVHVPDLEIWFLAQTASTPWGPTMAALTESERRELASVLVARLDRHATDDGGHRIPFGSYRLEAHRHL